MKSPTVQGATVSQEMTYSLTIYITHALTTSEIPTKHDVARTMHATNVEIFKCTIRLRGQRFCVLLANQNTTQFHIKCSYHQVAWTKILRAAC